MLGWPASVPGIYTRVTEAPSPILEGLVAALELRAANPQWRAMALVALLLACASRSEGPSPPPPPFVGRFSAVSESEWTLDLTLYPDGSAVIERSGWGGWSESDESEHEAIPAQWSLGPEGDLLLSYRGTTDVLRYFPDLSRAELGETGSAPGLRAFSPGAESVIGSHSLWRSDGPD